MLDIFYMDASKSLMFVFIYFLLSISSCDNNIITNTGLNYGFLTTIILISTRAEKGYNVSKKINNVLLFTFMEIMCHVLNFWENNIVV